MVLDQKALGCAGGELRLARQLCREGLGAVRAALAEGRPITIGCTQEAPVFAELADEAGAEIQFVNIREQAGWSDSSATGPKMAALLAAGAVAMPPTELVSLTSEGVALIYGRDETAIEVGRRLSETLDVTVLLTRPGAVTPPARDDFPVLRGTIRTATGHLGAFELLVDDTAAAVPSSRAALAWGSTRDGATSRCDIVIDLSGGTPLFPAHALRDGYLRADPARPETIEKVVLDAQRLVGTFDKPAYVRFNAALCAHSRSKRTGCTRCLDVCPTGAITPAGDTVSISAEICAGCGACASVCPTGAATYALPPAEAVVSRLRTMLSVYAQAGGTAPVVLLHDEAHGQALIDAAARFGRGLPAHVLPLRLNEVTQADIALVASAYAYGACGVVALVRERPRHDIASLHRLAELSAALLAPLGLAAPVVLETDDSDALWAIGGGAAVAAPSRYLPMSTGRHLAVTALKELHRAAGQPLISTPLPPGSPFGAVIVDTAGCTLCLACVAACPVGALRDDPDKPTLRFAEDACVQCGLCKATCPERVISLAPRLDLKAWADGAVTIKQEEPYPCISCGKPFGARSSVERIVAKLQEKHWMFSGPNARRIDVVRMCEDCRVEALPRPSGDEIFIPCAQFDAHASTGGWDEMFDNLKLFWKLAIPIAVLVATLGAVVVFASVQIEDIGESSMRLVDVTSARRAAVWQIQAGLTSVSNETNNIILESDTAKMQPFVVALRKAQQEAVEGIDALIRLADTEERRAWNREFKVGIEKFFAVNEPVVAFGLEDRNDEAWALKGKTAMPARVALSRAIDERSELIEKELAIARAGQLERLGSTSRTLLVTSTIGTIFVVALTAFIVRNKIVRPLNRVSTDMTRLSSGDLDIEVIGADRRDEVGSLARALAAFQRDARLLREAVVSTELDARTKAERVVMIAAMVQSFQTEAGGLIGMVSSASAELEATAHSMSGTALHANEQASNISASAEEASTGVQTTAAAAEQLTSSISEITRQMQQSSVITEKAVTEAHRTDEIVPTGEAVRAIRGITTTIEEVRMIAVSIASAVEEQGAATSEIARNVQLTATSTQAVTTSISGVSQAAGETGAAATQVLGAASDLSRQAEALNKTFTGFVADLLAA
eukprot:gene5318-5371_t